MQQAVGLVAPLFFELYDQRTIMGYPVYVVRMPDSRDAGKAEHGVKVFVGEGVNV